MQQVPQYMTLLIRKDGEEFGVFFYGSKRNKYRSIFPFDLADKEAMHETVELAIEYIGTIYQAHNNIVNQPKRFCQEMVRQREHVIAAEGYALC